jgi:SSS family solute:Na+ symporter
VSPIAIAVVLVYLTGVFLIGVYFSRRQDSTTQYFLGGRRLPGWAVAFSLLATITGSTTFVGHPGEVFRTHMWAFPLHLMLIVVIIPIALFVVPFYRRILKMSVYGYLERRFGYPARVYGGLAFIFSRIVDMSATFYFVAIAVTMLTGWDIGLVIVVVGIVTICYTYLGGITAVVWTDVMQGIVLIGSGLILLGYLLLAPDAPPGGLVAAAWRGGKFSWGDWGFSWFQDNVWVFLVLGLLWALQRYAVDQHMVQRYLIARSDREAQRAAYVGGTATFAVWVIFWTIGALLWAYYQLPGHEISPAVAQDPSRLVPFFVRSELPAVILGLVVAALTAAAMSSLDSDMNAVATVVVEDYFQKLRPDAPDSSALWVGRAVVIVIGSACVVAALQWIGVQSAIGFMFDLISVASAGVLGLFLLGILFERATARGAWVGILAGVLFTAWATFTAVDLPALGRPLLDLGAYSYGLNTKLIGVFSSLILLVIGLGASALLGGARPREERLTLWRLTPRIEGEREWA